MTKFLTLITYSSFLIPIFYFDLIILKGILKILNKKSISYKRYLLAFFVILDLDIFGIIIGSTFRFELILKISAILNMMLILLILSFAGSFSVIFVYLKLFFNKKEENGYHSDVNAGENKITRRDFFKKGILSVPLLPLAASGLGMYEGFTPAEVKKMTFYFKNLPKSFNGLKIAHISDLHLSFYLRIEDLKIIVEKLNKQNPDLLLITGDFVDDYVILDEAIELIKTVKTKYGIFASIGNHEYYRGVETVIKAFKKYNLPLLINKGVIIENKEEKIFIGGVDDPGITKEDIKPFLEDSLKKVLNYDKESSFKIIMSHRPKLLPVATGYNIDLVLSGHTHGGQIGFNGKSLFENYYPESFLWGKYQIDNTTLYTTSGAGSWFPFRINCPNEIPVITLKREG